MTWRTSFIDLGLAGFGIGLSALLCPPPAAARDYGQMGTVFPVLEPDFLRVIESRLGALAKSGGIDRMNQEFAHRSEASVRRPPPVVGIGLATRPRTWTYDPTLTLDHDIRDTRGQLVASAGTRVNPLDTMVIRTALVFIDADDADQIGWAVKRYTDLNAKIILVKGAPFEAMTHYQRRFYFDQGGFLTHRFGITATPAVVEQTGNVMRVSEIPVSIGRR